MERRRTSFRIGKSPYAEAGPDLAFIKLPEATVPLLQMHGTFLNVDRHQQLTAERDQSDDYLLDAVVGIVEEWEKAVTTANRGKVIRFNVLTNVGHVQKMLGAELEATGICLSPLLAKISRFPHYGGVSGAAYSEFSWTSMSCPRWPFSAPPIGKQRRTAKWTRLLVTVLNS